MIHPFLRVIATHPQLLVDHAEAYAGLVSEEVEKTAATWKHRFVFMAAAALLALLALAFGGVALMLFAVSPTAAIHAPWLLIATPVAPALAAVVLAWVGNRHDGAPFAQLKLQWARDMAMVREAGTA